MAIELLQKRDYNSKTFYNGDGLFTSDIHAGHIHYKDVNGNFQDVDFTLEDMGSYWRMVKANYNLYIAKDFGASQLIRFDNKFEGADHTIYYEPHSLQWVHKTTHDRILIKAAQNVTGTVSGTAITYTNAFGNNVDFVIQLKRHGFVKYIRFNVKPTLTPPSADYVPVLIVKYTGTGLKVKANNQPDWNDDSYYESDEGFSLSEVNPALKSYIRRAWIKDADDNQQLLKIFWEKRDNILWQAKILPKAFFASATYPVTADADTVYSGAGDGRVNEGGNATWAGTHDETTGNIANYTETEQVAAQSGSEAGPNYFITRGFLPYDTSILPDVATITAATLNVYITAKTDTDNDTEAFISVVQTSQPDPTQLTTADYDAIGTTEGIDAADRKDITNITISEWLTFTLNATGIGWINKTGWSYFGLREGHDLLDIAINFTGASIINNIRIRYSDYAAQASDPYLSVTYTLPTTILRRRRDG